MQPENLFDPSHYESVRRPLLEATTLPPWCYTSAVFYEREVECIFKRCWQFVGRSDEIPAPGDYLSFDGAGGPVVIIRGEDQQIRAFYNVCRHRGTRMLDGMGCARRVVCPYHSWVYRTDGSLERAPGMAETVGFDLEAEGLLPVRFSQWAGFMFICYAPDGPTLEHSLGNLPTFFESYQPYNLACVRRIEYQVQSNWKLLMENALEAYHTGTVHRDTLGRQDSKPVPSDGDWGALYAYIDNHDSMAVLPGTATSLPHIEGLTGDQLGGTYFTDLYPCTQFVFAQDSMWWLAIEPTGVDTCKLVLGSCFPESTIALENFEAALPSYYERWDRATPEDNAIAEAQQLGQSVNRPAGRFAAEEFCVHQLSNWVLDRVLD